MGQSTAIQNVCCFLPDLTGCASNQLTLPQFFIIYQHLQILLSSTPTDHYFYGGERGIRTLDAPFRTYTISNRALSTAQPSLLIFLLFIYCFVSFSNIIFCFCSSLSIRNSRFCRSSLFRLFTSFSNNYFC